MASFALDQPEHIREEAQEECREKQGPPHPHDGMHRDQRQGEAGECSQEVKVRFHMWAAMAGAP